MINQNDTNFILNKIINPICRRCCALENVCRGLTIKDWVAAKNCNLWEDRGYLLQNYSHLNVIDYLKSSEKEDIKLESDTITDDDLIEL